VSVAKGTTFQTNNRQASGPDVSFAPNAGVLVKFKLPRPEARGLNNGELHLSWAGGKAVKAHALPAGVSAKRPAAAAGKPNAERGILAKAGKLPQAKQKALVAQIKKAPAAKAQTFSLKATTSAKKVDAKTFALSLHAQSAPHVRSVADPARQAHDKKRYEALKNAFGGEIPGVQHAPK
jgi:hypothetical protein